MVPNVYLEMIVSTPIFILFALKSLDICCHQLRLEQEVSARNDATSKTNMEATTLQSSHS